MTTPTLYDFPDWQRGKAATDIRVSSGAPVVGAATATQGRFLVAGAPFLQVLFQVSAGGAKMTLDWYDAQTGGGLLGTNEIHVLAGLFAAGAVPCLGPYVEISLIADAAARIVTYQVWQSSTYGFGVPSGFPGQLISVDNGNIAAGTTRTDNANCVRWGWGFFHADIEATANTRIRLLAVTYLGATAVLDFVLNTKTGTPSMILLPPMPLRLESLNLNVGAVSLWASLWTHVGPW